MNTAIANYFQSLLEKVVAWAEQALLMAPNLLAALAAVAAFGLMSRRIQRVVCRGFGHVSDNEPIAQLLGQIARLATVAIGLFIGLSIMELEKTVTSLLAGVGVIGLALGFAFQDTAANFVSGVYMAVRRPIDTGDVIKAAGHVGTVERMELRSTLLRTFDGLSVFIPNKDIFQGVVVNYTRTGERRVEVEVGVSYTEDLHLVRRVAADAVKDLPGRDESREPDVLFTGFGASSIDLVVRVWLDVAAEPDWLVARSEAIVAIKGAFDAEGISIPFPIRTLDFGANQVGGRRLDALEIPA